MRRSTAPGFGVLAIGFFVVAAWQFLRHASNEDSMLQHQNIARLRAEVAELRAQVNLLRESRQNVDLAPPLPVEGVAATREAINPIDAKTSTNVAPAPVAETQELISLLWRCLRSDRDGIVAALEERDLSPIDPAVTPVVANVFSRLDDLRTRTPVNVELVRYRQETISRLESSLDSDSLTPKDRSEMTRQLEAMRRDQNDQEPAIRQFKVEYNAIIGDFLQRLPPKMSR